MPTVAIGPRIVASAGFDSLYRDGMMLIEEVAAYLDGDGRSDSRSLPREVSFTYAAESMRLTTRLMQLASWLLLQRAVNEGELTPGNARAEKSKIKFTETPEARGGPGYSALPQQLTAFIDKGDRLFERVLQFDRLERSVVPEPASAEDVAPLNSISDQLKRLNAAFGQLRR